MTRDEAIQLLNCSLSELADSLGITTAAVAKWNKDKIPRLREFEIRDIASKREQATPSKSQQNVACTNN
nr:ribonuclease D [Acinetobacter tandoii]